MNVELKWYTACYLRGGLSESQIQKYLHLKSKHEGQTQLLEQFKLSATTTSFLAQEWFGWFPDFCQIDALVVSDGVIYILEVHNDKRRYHYKNGEWWSNDDPEMLDAYYQLNLSIEIICLLLENLQIENLRVEGVLVDANPAGSIFLDEPINYRVLHIKDVSTWLNSLTYNKVHDDALLETVTRQANEGFADRRLYSLSPDKAIKPGCYCKKCGNFDLAATRRLFICQCGQTEHRQAMLDLMVDEYAMLFYQEPINLSGLRVFTRNAFSNHSYRKALQKYEKIQCGKYVNPYNKNLPKEPELIIEDK